MAAKGPKKRVRLMKFADRARAIGLFGQRLKDLRIKKGFSPTEFAKLSGIDRSNLDKYENGREPGLIVILIMAKALGISHLELMMFDFDFELEK